MNRRKVFLYSLMAAVILVMIAVVFVIKNDSSTAEFIGKYQLQESTFDPLTVYIFESVTLAAQPAYQISRNPVILELQNDSDFEYLYGFGYDLQIAYKEKWYVVPLHDAYLFPLAGLRLFSDTSVETVVDLDNHIEVIPGKYRIVKSLTEYPDGLFGEKSRDGYVSAIITLE